MKKKENTRVKKGKKQSTSTPQKQKKRNNCITLIEVLIIISVIGVISNIAYQILRWDEASASAKQLGFWGCAGVIIAVFIFRRLIDFIFDKLFD